MPGGKHMQPGPVRLHGRWYDSLRRRVRERGLYGYLRRMCARQRLSDGSNVSKRHLRVPQRDELQWHVRGHPDGPVPLWLLHDCLPDQRGLLQRNVHVHEWPYDVQRRVRGYDFGSEQLQRLRA